MQRLQRLPGTPIPTLHIALIGHVDHGKSTLAGRLLYELGIVSDDIIHEYKEQSALLGKSTFEYAWVMDVVMQERQTGLTIEPSYKLLEINEKRIILIDGPGHRKYTKNTILAIAAADATILVIAADDGIMEQTKEHAILAYALGIRDIIVVINKMDKTYPSFSPERFETLALESMELLSDIGFDSERVIILPAAAYFGENVTDSSEKMSWFSGPTVYDALRLLKVPDFPINTPFRMPIDKAFTKRGIGQVVLGRVASGTVTVGDECLVVPGFSKVKVRSLETFGEKIPFAFAGDDLGIALSGGKHAKVGRGFVLGPINEPPTLAKVIIAKVTVLPNGVELYEKRAPLLFVHSTRTVAKILGVISRISPVTDEVLERKPQILRSNQTGYVEIELMPPIVIEKANFIPRLSKFILREQDITVAVGTCIDIIE